MDNGKDSSDIIASDISMEDANRKVAFMIAETMMVYANPIDDANKSTK